MINYNYNVQWLILGTIKQFCCQSYDSVVYCQHQAYPMRSSKTFSSSDQPVDNEAPFNITQYKKWAKFVIIRMIGDSLNLEKNVFAIDIVSYLC